MSWIDHKIADAKERHWQQAHPYGEEGSVDYWIEAMKRAFEMGETRAQGEIDKLVAIDGPHAPMQFTVFPDWFRDLWVYHLAPYNQDRKHRMPY